jgi:putative DNA primase/helicase
MTLDLNRAPRQNEPTRRYQQSEPSIVQIDIRAAARALGGDVCGRDQVVCPGPGHSHQDRSLSVRLDPRAPDGFVVHPFAGDDPLACRDHVRERLGLPAWEPGHKRRKMRVTARPAGADPRLDTDRRIARATKLWNEARDPRGTIVEEYLASRALALPSELAGAVLRLHYGCPFNDKDTGIARYVPALLAIFRSIKDDAITGVHRIRLDQPQRWPKTERWMLGSVGGAAVKLAEPTDATLVIGEGVETCMAAMQLGIGPAWALGSAVGIENFPVVAGVTTLIILAETDKTGANETALRACGRRWHQAGRRVRVARPPEGCGDMNDVLMVSA